MIRKILSLVVVIAFGGALYGLVQDYKEDAVGTVENVKESVSTIVNGTVETAKSIASGEPIKVAEPEQITAVEGAVTTTEQLADAFYANLSNWETKFTIEFQGDTSQLGAMLDEAYASAKMRNGYVQGHLDRMDLTYEYTKTKATINVLQSYLTNAHQEEFVDSQVRKILPTIANDAMTDKEKVLAVNDYIVRNTVYGDATNTSPHSAFTVLMEGQAVCQGYALLAYKMIDLLGIEVLYVTGEAGGIGHAWNLVYVDEKWQHIDTTWNDPVPDRGDKVSHDYAFLNDKEMLKSHTWIRANYPQAQ